MKRNFLILLAMIVGLAAYGQKKPKINQANSLRESGDLAEAKSIIDDATTYEKTKDNGKTWYFRGLIYATIDTTSNEQYSDLKSNALQTAVESFDKAKEIDPVGNKYYITNSMGLPELMEQQISGYYNYYYNMAVTDFQDGNYADAVKEFEASYLIFPEDTNAYVNAAFAAHNGQLWEDAVRNYKRAIENGAQSTDLYYNYINILSTGINDKERALEAVNEALEKFPTDANLQKNRINLYIELDKVDEAMAELKEAIKNEPDNVSLLFTLAVMNEEAGNKDEARSAYQNAIKVNPDHYESNFNYGVMLINDANEVIKQSNALGLSKADQKKARELEPVIDEKLTIAMPQWEKILEIKPGDRQAMETLAYIYTQLNMKDKAKKMNDELDKL